MATTKTLTKATAAWSITNQEAMGKELGLSLIKAIDASMSFNEWIAKIHKASKGIIGTVRSKDPFMLAVQDVLKDHRYTNKAGKSVGYPAATIKTYLSNVRKAIVTGKKIDNGNSGKTNTILFALGQKAEPATMVESLRKGFNKMKANEHNPAMQRLAAFLIDALDDAVEA
jgi:hypothetical protein